MNTRNVGIFAWAAVAAAVAAWIAVYMYDSWISAQLDARSAQTTGVQIVADKEMAAVRLHALARDTANQRAQLDTLAQTNVIGVADTIDSIGGIAGVELKIGAATPEPVSQKKNAAKTPASTVVGFVIEANGTFASVMQAAALMESLPVPSSVQDLEFENISASSDSKSSKSTWHLTARVRVPIAAGI